MQYLCWPLGPISRLVQGIRAALTGRLIGVFGTHDLILESFL
jgi:hypothetical protein